MRALGLPFLNRLAGAAPLLVRVIVGVTMARHGSRWLQSGPANVGSGFLASLGVPAPVLMGFLLTFVELVGGVLLVLGLLSRIAALLLIVDLVLAILLVKVDVGFIAEQGAGAELDLALIAGFFTVLLMGPGWLALDRAVGIEPRTA